MSGLILQLHSSDSVAVAVNAIRAGDMLNASLCCREAIPAGHKVALRDVPAGRTVYKYGQPIGVAGNDIYAGSYVHTHNLRYSELPDRLDFASAVKEKSGGVEQAGTPLTFDGYVRPDGQAGTRNYIGIMSTVNCSATVVARIARHFQNHSALPGNVDGVIPLTHQTGCGIAAGAGVDLSLLRRVLTGYLHNPNFFGWVIVGLGCEVNQASGLLDNLDEAVGSRIHTIGIQDEGGTTKAVDKGVSCVESLLEDAGRIERRAAPLSALRVGLQCGGSDGWSGISANPALGAAMDRLVAAGGSAVLAETPEIFGAASLLLNRAANEQTASELRAKIDWWRDYLESHGQQVSNNPSPGNLAGGITTILEKSLGAVAKSGTSTLQQVVSYAERTAVQGLVFMDSPGYDPCSVTGEIASGANLICFTTGRGSTFGAAGAPTLKLASNHQLYARMADDMDVDCGAVVSGKLSVDEMGETIFETIVETASGRKTSSERLGLGEYEFVPWSLGATV